MQWIDNSFSTSNEITPITGRISRRNFWRVMLKCLLLWLGTYFCGWIMGYESPIYTILIGVIVLTAIRYFMCAAACRRFHDFNFSAVLPLSLFLLEVVLSLMSIWEIIVSPFRASDFLMPSVVVTLLNTSLWLFVAGTVPPTKGMNKYGSNPLRDFDEQVREYEQQSANH